jgi:hypothetical protein
VSVLLALSLALAAAPRSPAVYPPQELAIAMDHAVHLRAGGRCVECHAAASRSDDARDRLLPAERQCAICHRIEQAKRMAGPTFPRGECAVCHPGYDWTVHAAPRASVLPRANLAFSHRRHLGRMLGPAAENPPNDACARCHGDLAKVRLATRDELPKMATCLACHDGRAAPRACALCHPRAADARGARLRTALDSGALVPMPGNPLGLQHGPGFDRGHGPVARARPADCAACHEDASCRRCHDGAAKPLEIHPSDWISIHPVPARQDRPRCATCHRAQSFCAGCHERVGIGPQADPQLRAGGPAVHPPGWMEPGPRHHAVHATRRIGACASCHREEGCVACHGDATGGVSPHPEGFARRCAPMVRRNARACAKCHIGDAAALCR